MKQLIGAFILALVLFSCKEKEEVKPDCEVNNYGWVTINNESSHTVKINIDQKINVMLAPDSSVKEQALITTKFNTHHRLYVQKGETQSDTVTHWVDIEQCKEGALFIFD